MGVKGVYTTKLNYQKLSIKRKIFSRVPKYFTPTFPSLHTIQMKRNRIQLAPLFTLNSLSKLGISCMFYCDSSKDFLWTIVWYYLRLLKTIRLNIMNLSKKSLRMNGKFFQLSITNWSCQNKLFLLTREFNKPFSQSYFTNHAVWNAVMFNLICIK